MATARNPYLRIKKTQANWSLTAQLSQPKSATDSLPTATRLLLGAAPVSSFSNYNQPTELKNAVGTTSAISLNANNTATRIIANHNSLGVISISWTSPSTMSNLKCQPTKGSRATIPSRNYVEPSYRSLK